MFTEQILKSILSLKTFSATARANRPALEGIHISVDAANRTITALATDAYAVARMTITVPECAGESWSRNVSIATLNAALASIKAGGTVSVFPEAYMPEYPIGVCGMIDKFVNSENTPDGGDFNAKYLGALAKINVGGDKSGRWTIRATARDYGMVMVATAAYGSYEVAVTIAGLSTRG